VNFGILSNFWLNSETLCDLFFLSAIQSTFFIKPIKNAFVMFIPQKG